MLEIAVTTVANTAFGKQRMSDPTGTPWTDREIELIVADYFDMLSSSMRGEPYVKKQRYEELQRLTRRTRGSIERKHMNISAVLERLGLPWLKGYAPMRNFQDALIAAVEPYMVAQQHAIETQGQPVVGLAEGRTLFVGPPPPLSEPLATNHEALERLARKFDPAARDQRNRALGRKGEELVWRNEVERLRIAGRADLASKVKWVSQEEGDGAGFDILSFTQTGKERFLEVKTTIGHARTPFFISRNEKEFGEERQEGFRIFRLYEFGREAKAFLIRSPLEQSVILEPESYRASFG